MKLLICNCIYLTIFGGIVNSFLEGVEPNGQPSGTPGREPAGGIGGEGCETKPDY